MYLDASGAPCGSCFSFTPATYLDRRLEDISIVLENAVRGKVLVAHRQEGGESGGAPTG
jgi:hypothetical protein